MYEVLRTKDVPTFFVLVLVAGAFPVSLGAADALLGAGPAGAVNTVPYVSPCVCQDVFAIAAGRSALTLVQTICVLPVVCAVSMVIRCPNVRQMTHPLVSFLLPGSRRMCAWAHAAFRKGRRHMDILVVVDMQNDFIDGALGTPEAQAIVPRVVERMRTFDGPVICTRDTHASDYLSTQEGTLLPVVHCVKGTPGWQLEDRVAAALELSPVDKPSFGSLELMDVLRDCAGDEEITSITFCGLCTDICVISNAIIAKAAFPEVPVAVDSACCAGVTPESHERALEALAPCQVRVI